MNLLSIQRDMARAVMMPLTPSERMRNAGPDGRSQRTVANAIIKPNDRLTSFERLEIYNRQYWFRVLSGFSEDFPGLRAVLGDRLFDKITQAYLRDCPSRSFSMRNIGAQLEGWLRTHPNFAGPRQQIALDMVRLEWAEINAFDDKRYDPLKAEDLANTNPAKLRLNLQPHLTLLNLRYPVDDLLLQIRKDSTEGNVASNAFIERQKSKRTLAIPILQQAPIFLFSPCIAWTKTFIFAVWNAKSSQFSVAFAMANLQALRLNAFCAIAPCLTRNLYCSCRNGSRIGLLWDGFILR